MRVRLLADDDERFSVAKAVNEFQLSQCFKTGLRQGALYPRHLCFCSALP